MADKKYQIFVSSTYADLKDERDVVIKAILEMGHIPVGMEMFSAGDDEQWKIIARHIDESDYYCVIVARRYGSTVNGTSYTQKEYEYAVERGVPVLGFVLDDSASWPGNRTDIEPVEVESLSNFRSLVLSKPVSFWKTSDDLYGKVAIALGKAFTANPRVGWARASEVTGPEALKEVTRLSAENAALREAVRQLQDSQEADRTGEDEALVRELRSYKREFAYKYSRNESKWHHAKSSLFVVFAICAPSLLTEVDLEEAAKDLAMNLREDESRNWWLVATNQVRSAFADLSALGLIMPSQRKHAVADKGEYWSLTERGIRLHSHVRLTYMKTEEPDTDDGDLDAVDDDENTQF